MSVFSIIRRGRQQAKQHSAKQAEAKKKEEAKPPYKHVPTHAAIDALSGAPSSWREEDRPRILEQNRRRSALTLSGIGVVHPGGLPRVASSLSHVSYPSAAANPMVKVPRAYSYNGGHPYHGGQPVWQDQNGDVIYSAPEPTATPRKGKGVMRSSMYEPGRASSSSSAKGLPPLLCAIGIIVLTERRSLTSRQLQGLE
jgi:hypothetical protein